MRAITIIAIGCTLLAAAARGADAPFWRATANADVKDGVLFKTGGCDGCADAGATAPGALTSGGFVEITASETDSNRFVGLTNTGARFLGFTHQHTATSYTDLDYSLYFIIGGYVEVREHGTYFTDTTYAPGDRFRIVLDGTAVRYLKNGEVFYVSTAAPKYPLDVGALLMSSNATVRQLVVQTGR